MHVVRLWFFLHTIWSRYWNNRAQMYHFRVISHTTEILDWLRIPCVTIFLIYIIL
jgi:hypothetical protein